MRNIRAAIRIGILATASAGPLVPALADTRPCSGAPQTPQARHLLEAHRMVYHMLFTDTYEYCQDAILYIDDNLCDMGEGATSAGTNSVGEEFSIDVLEYLDELTMPFDASGGISVAYAALLRAELRSSIGAVTVLGIFVSYELEVTIRTNKFIVISAYSSSTGGGDARTPWAWIPALGATALCVHYGQLCVADALTAMNDCIRGCDAEIDDPNNRVDCKECCQTKFDQDVLNCLMSCGTNGPDGDYDNCWEFLE